jgi:N-acetylglutamate synthase-like GNAT family acetyltransferase
LVFPASTIKSNMARDRAGCKSMSVAFAISDLRQRPEFFDTVAMRIWRAWWEAEGASLDYISGRLRENMSDTPIPFALVAHDAEAFLGTASVIASDLVERAQLTPWVAAVWVEPQVRGHGLGAALVGRAAQDCFALDIARAYLCARPRMFGFYDTLGWTLLERGVGRQGLDVFFREAGNISSPP